MYFTLCVVSATMPELVVSNGFGFTNMFMCVDTNCRLLYVLRSPITIEDEFLYGITTVGWGSLLRNELGWYGSRGFFSMPACRVSRTLNWCEDSETVSELLFVLKSIGLGAPLLNARHTACPFFCSTWLQEATFVFLNIAADFEIFYSRMACSAASLTLSLFALSISSFTCWAIWSLIVAIFD